MQRTIPFLMVSVVVVIGMGKTLWQTYSIAPSYSKQSHIRVLRQMVSRWRSFYVGIRGFLYATRERIALRDNDDGVLVVDSNGRMVAANKQAQQLLPTGWLFQPITILSPQLKQIGDSKRNHPLEINLDETFYQVMVLPFSNWRQRPLGYTLILHNITSDKQAAQQKQEMTQTMIHDLRSPLTNTLSALQMFQNDGGDLSEANNQLLLEMMISNTERTLSMVDSLLDIERLADKNSLHLNCMPLAFTDLVETMLQSQIARARQKQVLLYNELSPTLPMVYGDERLLGRVVQNLVDNSIKFCQRGDVVRISAKQAQADRLEIVIEDTGPGIPAEKQQAIFDKFVTGDLPTSGAGIGLAFCQMAIQAHQGRIWVESSPGQGSRFLFTLPLAS